MSTTHKTQNDTKPDNKTLIITTIGLIVLLCIAFFLLGKAAVYSEMTEEKATTTAERNDSETPNEPVVTLKQGVYKADNNDGTVSIMAIFNDVPDGSNCVKFNHITIDRASSLNNDDLRQLTHTEDYCRWKRGQTWGYDEPEDNTGLSLRYHKYLTEYGDGTDARIIYYMIEQPDDNMIIETNKGTNEITTFSFMRSI